MQRDRFFINFNMDIAGKVIDSVYEKVRTLINLQDQLKKLNADLINEQVELKQIIENQIKEIEQLKDKNKNLKISKSIKQTEESSDAKKKIDDLMREIDKCIGLLNK